MKARLKAIMHELKRGIITKEQAVSKVASAKGWISHANTHNYTVANHINELWEEVNTSESFQ